MKVKINPTTEVEITQGEIQTLVNAAIRHYHGLKDYQYGLLDVLDLLIARAKTNKEFQAEYNQDSQGD